MHERPIVSTALLALTLAAGCHRAGTITSSVGVADPQIVRTADSTPIAPKSTAVASPVPLDVSTLVARVKPAVVNITTISMELEEGGSRRALGSGFIVDPRGFVVTNAHVVEHADSVRVKLADDREFDAKVKGRDVRLDLAVLELIGAQDLPTVPLGISDAVKVGEPVVAIGNPFGLGHTVTMGIVSATGRAIGAGPYDDFIQTDASINPGNSGGPLFDLRGEVIGINTAINPNGQGIGFASPIDALKSAYGALLKDGFVRRGKLGVRVQGLDMELAKALGLDRPEGALVSDVEKNGPSEKAGLRSGDLIVAVDDAKIGHDIDLPRLVARHEPGAHVAVKAIRDGKSQVFEVVLAELDDRLAKAIDDAPKPTEPAHTPRLGVQLGERDGDVIVERVLPGSAADGVLLPGDVIVELDHQPIAHAKDFAARAAQSKPGAAMLVKIEREGKTRFVGVERK